MLTQVSPLDSPFAVDPSPLTGAALNFVPNMQTNGEISPIDKQCFEQRQANFFNWVNEVLGSDIPDDLAGIESQAERKVFEALAEFRNSGSAELPDKTELRQAVNGRIANLADGLNGVNNPLYKFIDDLIIAAHLHLVEDDISSENTGMLSRSLKEIEYIDGTDVAKNYIGYLVKLLNKYSGSMPKGKRALYYQAMDQLTKKLKYASCSDLDDHTFEEIYVAIDRKVSPRGVMEAVRKRCDRNGMEHEVKLLAALKLIDETGAKERLDKVYADLKKHRGAGEAKRTEDEVSKTVRKTMAMHDKPRLVNRYFGFTAKL